MNDVIGSTDGMGEPGSGAWARVTGIATAGILVAEGRTRGRLDAERGRQHQDRRRDAEDRLRAAADRTRHTPPAAVAIEHIPDSKTTAAMWYDAATTPSDPTAAERMRAAERHLRISEPDLMARYDAEVRAGRDPLAAMSTAMRQATPNPHPPASAPAQAWPTGQTSPRLRLGRGDPHAHTPSTPAATVGPSSHVRRLRNLFTGKGTRQ